MIPISALPTVNAILNSLSAVLLIAGYIFIRRKNVSAHRTCMMAAMGASAIFLISYLTYHYHHGSTRFAGQSMARAIYFAVLISHTILAAVVLPMALTTFYRAMKKQFARHAAIARWTFPVWLYVSITGVIVYLMLYHIYASR